MPDWRRFLKKEDEKKEDDQDLLIDKKYNKSYLIYDGKNTILPKNL